MSVLSTLGLAAVAILLAEGIARLRGGKEALVATVLVQILALAALTWAVQAGLLVPLVVLAPALVALMGTVAVLARPPGWREPVELARLAETTLLVALTFACEELLPVALLWLVSLLPGLRYREHPGVSRRPFALKALLSAGAALSALVLLRFAPEQGTLAWLALVLAAAIRMGVPPFSPLVLSGYQRLPMGRHALVAAARPSVALLLAARLALPEAVEPLAPLLQGWAATAAVLAGLQGLAAQDLRRSVGAMATTQASIILYGLVSTGHTGVAGALVQWAGLGLSLVGIGVLVEAIESRVGEARARSVRGLMGPAPGMALLFLLFAASMSGFPGTTGFVGEDLIMQAPSTQPVLWRGLLLLATALNGFTMLRVFARVFLGRLQPEEVRAFPALTLRERAVLGVVVLALGVLVASPAWVVA